MLRVENITVRYGGILALSRCSLEVRAGQAAGLIGPNGSGKTTLLDVVSGFVQPVAGAVYLDGQLLNGLLPYRRARLGVARGFQMPRAFADMTCLDNLLVAAEGRYHHAAHRLAPREALELVGLSEYAAVLPRYLSFGQRRLLDLARALCSGARLLLLDEPSAGVTPLTTERIVHVLGEVHNLGISLVVVEHNLQFVRRVSDELVALIGGAVVTHGPPEVVLADQRVRDAYFGRPAQKHDGGRYALAQNGRDP